MQSRDEFDEKHLNEGQTKKLYDSILYQNCLRTLHELFEADARTDVVRRFMGSRSVRSVMVIPIRDRDQILGHLALVEVKQHYERRPAVQSIPSDARLFGKDR